MRKVNIGVLAFQGDLEEHLMALERSINQLGLEGEVTIVKKPSEAKIVHGLTIPGGESTVIGSLSSFSGALEVIKQRIAEGMPVMGTCAGMIFLAKRVYDRIVGETGQVTLGMMDITVERNTFGRQRESFEVELDIPIIGKPKFKAVFIRSPSVKEVGPGVETVAKLGEVVVGVKQGNMLGLSFHPELTDDLRIHKYLVKLASRFSSLEHNTA